MSKWARCRGTCPSAICPDGRRECPLVGSTVGLKPLFNDDAAHVHLRHEKWEQNAQKRPEHGLKTPYVDKVAAQMWNLLEEGDPLIKGTSHCHEMSTDLCQDATRSQNHFGTQQGYE